MASWCPNCGRQTDEGEKFCRRCGMPQNLTGKQASTWVLTTQPPPTKDEPAYTQPIKPAHTDPQTGPAYLPPTGFYTPPPPPQVYVPPQSSQTRILLGDWLSDGWKIYSENWLLMSVATLLTTVLSVCTLGILGGPLLMGLYRMVFKTLRGERPEMNDLFAWEGRFLQAFLAFLIFAAIHLGLSGGGGVLGILGFLVSPLLTVMMSLTMPLMLERRMDVAQAINEVGRLVFSRDAFMWWVVGLVYLTISAAGFAGCGLGVFVTMPWMLTSSAIAYRTVFGMDDPNRTNQ
jgi:hypothetical protein